MYDEPHRDTAETERFGDEPPSPRGGRNLWLWLGAVAVAALVIVAAVFALTRDGDDEAEGTETAAVPAVVGLQEDQATLLLEETGFEVAARSAESPEPAGTVVAQDPEAETELELGSTVTITVSAGDAETVTVTGTETQPPPTVTVPDVVGIDHADAGSHVDELGLIADTFPVDSDEPRGTVVAQDPAPGSEVASTEHVRLDVSVGPGERELAEIPDVTGPRGARARAIARETGWTVRTVDRDAPSQEEVGEVILQEPEAGSEHPVLTQITLFVGR